MFSQSCWFVIGKIDIDSNINIDLITHELARRTNLCFLGVRMEGHGYRKIYGYGKKMQEPSRPIKDDTVVPRVFASEKDAEKFQKRQEKIEKDYQKKLVDWQEELRFINQKMNLILPSGMNSPTNLPAKFTCCGGSACRNGFWPATELGCAPRFGPAFWNRPLHFSCHSFGDRRPRAAVRAPEAIEVPILPHRRRWAS